VNQAVDTKGIPAELIGKRGTVEVNPGTLSTNMPGVFAGGDAVTGTAYIVDAVGAGHRAAVSIDRYLQGLPLDLPDAPAMPVVKMDRDQLAMDLLTGKIAGGWRPAMGKLSPEERRGKPEGSGFLPKPHRGPKAPQGEINASCPWSGGWTGGQP